MYLKKIIRDFLYLVPSSMILMFHHITENPMVKRSGCILSTELFYNQIEKYSNYDTLENVLKRPSKLKIALTFDDGLEDLYTIAYPYLKKREIPFTIFIVPEFLDLPGYLTTEQLRKLGTDKLVTIGSHGLTHQILKGLEYEDQRKELIESKSKIENIIQKEVKFFAYSHGQYDKTTLILVGKYKNAFIAECGKLPLNFWTTRNKKKIRRLNIENATYEESNKILQKVFKGLNE